MSDRYTAEPRLQGYGRGSIRSARCHDAIATHGIEPDLTVLLDVEWSVAQCAWAIRWIVSRVPGPPSQVRNGYLELAAADPDRWLVVDADGTVDEVAARVDTAVEAWLAANPRADLVVGQQEAVRRLEAAVGTVRLSVRRAGWRRKRRVATVFAGELLAVADPDNAERHRRLAVDESHADVHMLDPVGNNLPRRRSGAAHVQASRSPVEGKRKVPIVNRFHGDRSRSGLVLKTIEEPPATSIFVLLAEDVPPEHITIESRCTSTSRRSPRRRSPMRWLRRGLPLPSRHRSCRCCVGQRRTGAHKVADDRLVARRDAWWSIRTDSTARGSGAVMVEEVRALIDDAGKAKVAQHEAELEAMDAREEKWYPRLRSQGSRSPSSSRAAAVPHRGTLRARHPRHSVSRRLSQATIAVARSTVSMRCAAPRTRCATPTRHWRSSPVAEAAVARAVRIRHRDLVPFDLAR